jgi:hypothetical protein
MSNKEQKTILRKGGETVKTTNYIVKSIGFDFETHKSYGISYENMDLINNTLVSNLRTEWEIEDQYEGFWNRLNDIKSSWYSKRTEIVKVLEVYPIEEFISKFPNKYKNMIEKTSPLEYGFYPIETNYRKRKNELYLLIDGVTDKVKNLLNFKLLTIKN